MQRARAEDPTAGEVGLTPGQGRLGDRYELGAMLGQGGMAVVRRGTDLRLGRTVAVKLLLDQLTDDPEFQARFRREARAAAGLDHPAIVTVYDAGEDTADDVVPYIVMEYVEGKTLRELLRTEPRLPVRRALEIIADVLDALAYSHRGGIVHRDIKPGNVMVTPSGAVKVMDFGIARALTDLSGSLTRTSAVLGTAQYLSPEQARGDSADARSDVYAVGCVLYELLTGRPPFQGESAVAVAYQHVRETPQPPSAFEPTVPAEVDALVLAALAKLPDERYQSADEMRADILAVLAGEPAPTTPIPVVSADTTELRPVTAGTVPAETDTAETDTAEQAVVDPRRRRRLGYLVAAAAALLLVAFGGFALSGLGEGPGTAPEPGPGAGPGQMSTEPGGSGSLEPAGARLDDPSTGGTPEQDGPTNSARPESTEGEPSETTDPETDETTEPTQTSDPTSSPTPPTTSTPEQTATSEPSPSETQSTEPSEPGPSVTATTP
ncbi:MAG: Stk1 family PASTA domain-containing Ser/Thr kinase [Propionibacteriales bacterium]|nr:Stk1 family PASTA domain-containing Ser/Thr kinase [Propionibacteriales bacterium]